MVKSSEGGEKTRLVQEALKTSCVKSKNNCPTGTYFDSDTESCLKCEKGCADCTSTGNVCTTRCKSPCSDCVGENDKCIECSRNLLLVHNE